MKKIKFGIGSALMLTASLISEKGELIAIYLVAALIHELGHLFAAKLRGIKVERIEFGFSGARIIVDRGLCSYSSEAILALFGPLANLIAAALVMVYAVFWGCSPEGILMSGIEYMESGGMDIVGILGFFAASSIVQAAVNLLPVRSFDGGRILYCILAEAFCEDTAERWIAVGTAFSTFILWTVALYLMLKVAAGLSVFVFAACIFFSCKN